MFGWVRRGDLALAVIASAGLLAGVTLTIAAKIGITGPVLIGLSSVAGGAAAVSGIRAQVSALLDRQHAQRDRLVAIEAVPIWPLTEIDPFTIGVFPSALAQTAQRSRAGGGPSGTTIPPYVQRNVDESLRRSLEEPSLARTGRLVVLRGGPKSGKSRSLWEAVCALPGRRLLA